MSVVENRQSYQERPMGFKKKIRNWMPRGVRNWLRIPSRSLRYVWDRIWFALGHHPVIQIRHDWNLKCHPAARELFEVFRKDPDQKQELELFIRNCPAQIRLLDAGAHFGFFALAALHYGGPDAEVVCVEASPKAAKVLEANLTINNVEKRVRILNLAMGGQDGVLPMLTTGPFGADYFVLPTCNREDTIEVRQKTLPTLLRETGFEPTHIKLDVEGAEYEVIETAARLLAEKHPVIFLELHPAILAKRGKNPELVLQMLEAAGYSRFTTEDGTDLEKGNWIKTSCRMVCE